MNDIPRYKASFPLQTVFITNSDACGDHIFTQIVRQDDFAIYRRNNISDNKCMGWETIVIKTVKAGTVYAKGAKPTVNDTESYPGSQSFGRLGWYHSSLEAAKSKLEELTQRNVNSKIVKKYIVPDTEFTFIEFASINKLPIDKNTAGIIHNLILNKEFNLNRVEVKNGKSTQIFGKA